MRTTTLGTTALGTNGPQVSVQGLGCMGMSQAYGPAVDRETAFATFGKALELGVTLFDTADVYGVGHNEELVGAFLGQGNRDRVFLATKFALIRQAADNFQGQAIRGDAAYVKQAVEASLKRLGTDHIDLYYMHRRDVTVPIEETVGAMAELVKEGKVGHLGLSEVTADELRAASAVHHIKAVQSEWSLFSRDIEKAVVPAARDLGTALVPFSPLGRGFLTGAIPPADELSPDDFRRSLPRFSGDNEARNRELLEPLRTIAAAHGVTPAQVALAWVQQRSQVWGLPVVPIPGTTKQHRLAENAGAVAVELSASDLADLEPIAGQVAGDRSPDMSFVSGGRE